MAELLLWRVGESVGWTPPGCLSIFALYLPHVPVCPRRHACMDYINRFCCHLVEVSPVGDGGKEWPKTLIPIAPSLWGHIALVSSLSPHMTLFYWILRSPCSQSFWRTANGPTLTSSLSHCLQHSPSENTAFGLESSGPRANGCLSMRNSTSLYPHQTHTGRCLHKGQVEGRLQHPCLQESKARNCLNAFK